MPVSPQDVDKAHISSYNIPKIMEEIDDALMGYGPRTRCTVTKSYLPARVAESIVDAYKAVGWIVDASTSFETTIFTFKRGEPLPPPKHP